VSVAALLFVNWIFWAALSAGTLLVVGLTERLGGTTRGYRLFMAGLLVVLAMILVLSDLALPAPDPLVPAATTEGVRRILVIVFAAGCLLYLVASVRNWPRSGIAIGTGILGFGALVSLALAGGVPATGLFAGQLILAGLALGAVTAAMLLGHWYLVTPRLSPTPLRRMMWLLLGVLVLQGLTFGIALLVFDTAPIGGTLAWLIGLRFVVGILIPILTTVLALLASRAASLQASTGLLYIGMALVIAGTIAGPSLSYLTGVPV
jgi:hypothetical protein